MLDKKEMVSSQREVGEHKQRLPSSGCLGLDPPCHDFPTTHYWATRATRALFKGLAGSVPPTGSASGLPRMCPKTRRTNYNELS